MVNKAVIIIIRRRQEHNIRLCCDVLTSEQSSYRCGTIAYKRHSPLSDPDYDGQQFP
ncbi:MAG: hypothetical protein V7K40_34340 [Nostoc sp.]|uniref:hypothetical protein n=1 Tax=Nostoc sp. TaxID=1180 RepID=UPI002FFC0A0F